jgi:hypothetical protein
MIFRFYIVLSDPLAGDTVTAKVVDRVECSLGHLEIFPKAY